MIGVNDKHKVRRRGETLDPTQRGLELFNHAIDIEQLLLGVSLKTFIFAPRLQINEFVDAFFDGLKIGERPAHPTVVDIMHLATLRTVLDDFARLHLGAHKEHILASPHGLNNEI